MIELATLRGEFAPVSSIGLAADVSARIERVLESVPMDAVRSLLDRFGLVIEPAPIVHKYVSSQHLRLMFPVEGGGVVKRGTVVSVVCLYDCVSEETLYAHPMHAGPDVNPLLKHPDGPMASPKAQPGEDGDRATTRMIAHKEALWQRYLLDVDVLGSAGASSRWRKGYYWALKRLYFCARCTSCRWGTPFFDGPDPDVAPKTSAYPVSSTEPELACEHAEAVEGVLSSDVWKIETAYAQRGGFAVSDSPRIIRDLGNGFLQLIFPTDVALVQGGTLVAVSVVYSTSRKETVFAHCLSVGPEPEIQFMLGDAALGLPQPCANASEARERYATWRREAWSRFWLDELEGGIAIASERWLGDFWLALQNLFGGNDLPTLVDPIPLAIEPIGSVVPALPFETLQNAGSACFAGHAVQDGFPELRALELSTIMVNLGRRCNLSCSHCHVDAGPHRIEEMTRETVDQVVDLLRRHKIDTLDITGGAPEMNPHFRYLASKATDLCRRVVDRCNLTILVEPGYEDLAGFLAEQRIEIVASLPYYEADIVDGQRGSGTFEKSIEGLRMLNVLGYGHSSTGLIINLVYNPVGTDLASPQSELEERFKRELRDQYGVVFNRLFAMNNMPVNRFRDQLERDGNLASYMDQLVGAFNPATVSGLMCRHSLSVGWDGRTYDCDFNQGCAVPVEDGLPNHIRDFDNSLLRARAISTRTHCFGCTAGAGSSCNGALLSGSDIVEAHRNGRRQPITLLDTGNSRNLA